jgi:hypothetical protein
MNKTKAFLATVAMTIAFAPQAEARTLEQILKECGIGGAIFKHTPAAAAISNIIWDLGTTATLSDMTGKCSYGKNLKVAMFIGSSYDKLETELASGKGEYVETLSSLSGKSVEQLREDFSKTVKHSSYATMTKEERADKLYSVVVK